MAGSERGKGRGNKNDGLIAALRHPLRRKILRRMSDGERTSPSELARELDAPLASVAYHVQILVGCDALRPDGERQVRGAAQHFYRWSVESEWARSMLEEDEEQAP
jgi:DNA-binding transcriptional ArsR family regulator